MIAPDVAKSVYEKLLGQGHGVEVDYQEAAQALHEATWELRERGVPSGQWIPSIHIGL